jgi:hypothetical protein
MAKGTSVPQKISPSSMLHEDVQAKLFCRLWLTLLTQLLPREATGVHFASNVERNLPFKNLVVSHKVLSLCIAGGHCVQCVCVQCVCVCSVCLCSVCVSSVSVTDRELDVYSCTHVLMYSCTHLFRSHNCILMTNMAIVRAVEQNGDTPTKQVSLFSLSLSLSLLQDCVNDVCE